MSRKFSWLNSMGNWTELADRVYIIEKGEIRYEGTPAGLAANADVRQKYLMV